MKLMTKEIEKIMPLLYSTEELKDPVARVKFFHPLSNYAVYLIEYDPDKHLGFGLVVGQCVELGYVSLAELESVIVGGLKMERDLYYKEEKLSVAQERHKDI